MEERGLCAQVSWFIRELSGGVQSHVVAAHMLCMALQILTASNNLT